MIPSAEPTRAWVFRTLDLNLSFGEYKPAGTSESDAPWGLDMYAVGPHDSERPVQTAGDGDWAKPAWAETASVPDALSTDRALLMDGSRPLLPGASVRGPLRHAYSRAQRRAGREVADPHNVQGEVGEFDPAGHAFGTVWKSSRILIRDARAQGGWAAAKLHMHAEDEFSAGSFGSAKRDAVRLLQGTFPVRIVVEGSTVEEVDPLVALIDRQLALGALGHLPIGGHKTRGAGWGRWCKDKDWVAVDVKATRTWKLPVYPETPSPKGSERSFPRQCEDLESCWVQPCGGGIEGQLTLGLAGKLARSAFGQRALIAWWCDPTVDAGIDLASTKAPATFWGQWPSDEDKLEVDEIAFFARDAVWRAARTSADSRFVFIAEVKSDVAGAVQTRAVHTPARLHNFRRFSSAPTGQHGVLLREWRVGDEILGFTITEHCQ